jgi:chromosome segregation ATPase
MSQMQQQGRMDRAAAAVVELGGSAQDEVLRLKTLIRQREGEVQGGKATLRRMEGELDTAKRQLSDARKRIAELEAGQDRMAQSRHVAEERVVAAGGDAERLASELHAAKRRVSGPPISFILGCCMRRGLDL